MKKKKCTWWLAILIPVAVGIIVGLSIDASRYQSLVKPFLAPPGYVFPIVWTILYILMGISSYLVCQGYGYYREVSLKLYGLQLVMNGLWSFIFFQWDLKILAFLWILLLIFVVYQMIRKFSKINRQAAWLQVPYLLWLIFAAYLNLAIVILNH